MSWTTQEKAQDYAFCGEAISARDMAKALNTVAAKLGEWGLITSSGIGALTTEASRLARFKDKTNWSLEIDRSSPILFSETTDKNGSPIFPRIVCEGIEVSYSHPAYPPFTAFDIAIEIVDQHQAPVARWHVDLANEKDDGMQGGPLTHIQFGGHFAGHREKDHPLKVPRWCHPPMDVILLCEVAAANFYPDEWTELREDPSWCQAVHIGQRLCYSAYLNKVSSSFALSSKTLLHSMWASEWKSST